ncbi:pilus assembly protein PilP [Vibrio aestuarianus]|uniref:pilus assembly protein PilP n=1 Tax=Vibrio aestuarianus TaxID=28171 RepID=UPI00237D23E0|nr:pilus assembly protein PilP [Vibrio aestuarianus]MDE1237492.1 pilus assembly protein PilP [Vibrio aestuarianus]
MEFNRFLVMFFLMFSGLVGCKANQDSLSDYVSQVEGQALKATAELKPLIPLNVARYEQRAGREPFLLPPEAIVANHPTTKADCWQPPSRPRSGLLERYTLSELRLKGLMSRDGSVSALIQTPQGNVVIIKAGQYVGENHGKVTRVDANYLLINEIVPDGLGCWNKRNVKLAL